MSSVVVSQLANAPTRQRANQAAPLGVILSQFPRYDEAFILRELVALAQHGQELVIFSLRPCQDRIIHEQAKALQLKTVYAPFLWSQAVWASHAHFLGRAPRAYLGTLGWMLSRHWSHPAILLKTLALFPKTVHFARLAQERGVTHLHAFWATYPAASALIMGRLTGIPFSMSGHAHDLYTTNPTLVEKVRSARFVLTCTEHNRRFLESLTNGDGFAGSRVGEFAGWRVRGSASSRVGEFAGSHEEPAHAHTRTRAHVVVNYHGVDLAKFAAVPKTNGPTCHLLSVSSLLPCKGFETLIEACRVLRDRQVAFHCTIAGGGPLEGALRKQIARQGLSEHIRITGFVSQETIVALYQDAHLFVLPLVSKIHWGIPNVLIEALATKTPVICCDLPSMQELIAHGRSGWLVREDDAQALAQSIQALWNDASLRARMAEAGYQRVVERFSLEQTGRALRELFATGHGTRDAKRGTGDARRETGGTSHVQAWCS